VNSAILVTGQSRPRSREAEMANLLSLLAWHGVAITFAALLTAPMWRNPDRATRRFATLRLSGE
jgi:hypothetical protein